eukprot:gnl/Spiro4/237_TR141_c0_g1_i1.p1 gnl/Spiro4/237_TR141_c0_g1~~gnl/Spiro4/237_TR141_c0_g1_i1.p1  ORF type:complete len:226 (-),score=20.62 gnl/Spiro4/237_TR141_c0_g1_i1:75-752(-)
MFICASTMPFRFCVVFVLLVVSLVCVEAQPLATFGKYAETNNLTITNVATAVAQARIAQLQVFPAVAARGNSLLARGSAAKSGSSQICTSISALDSSQADQSGSWTDDGSGFLSAAAPDSKLTFRIPPAFTGTAAVQVYLRFRVSPTGGTRVPVDVLHIAGFVSLFIDMSAGKPGELRWADLGRFVFNDKSHVLLATPARNNADAVATAQSTVNVDMIRFCQALL